MKTYKRRDSATSVLRKMGIGKKHYNKFIFEVDGQYRLDLESAEKFLIPKSKKRSKTTTHKNKTTTISGFMKNLILEGKTNQEIFQIAQLEFGEEVINEKKKNYPSWYRCQMRRNGELPEACDFQPGELPPRFE